MESGLGHQTDIDAAINKLTALVEMLVQDIQDIKQRLDSLELKETASD